MHRSSLAIELASRADVPEILDLQECNLLDNGGMLSVPLSHAWIEAAISDMPVLVARSDGRVVGYVAATTLAAQADIPIVELMLRTYPGSAGAYIYGPICVAESRRGCGLARAMFAELLARLPGREGFTLHSTRQHRLDSGAHRDGNVGGRPPNSLMAASPISWSSIRGDG